jgi:PAS domain S-box-containing protein
MVAAELSASELRYRRLFEAARDGILILDPETRKIIDVNPFLVEFLGYTYAEFIGKELYEIGLLKDEAASQAAFRDLLMTGYIRYEDLPLETKNGRRVDVEFVSNIYQEGEQQVIQCNVRDITTRKATENALRAADLKLSQHAADLERVVTRRTAELELSNTQLETFVYSIAHDLRAPLRAMQGFAQLLVLDHSANLSQQGRDYAQFIDTAAQTMDRLLADLLAFSHITQQKIELVPVALETVVLAALSACETALHDSDAHIEMIPPWPTVLAHPATLRQVLVNLIGNAVKFDAGQPPQVRLRAEERPGGIVRIWVEDDGIGIPPEFHDRIFQVFQRLHTTEYAGTGIGLAIVQKGVERMGGHVGLVSAPGEGSEFWIELAQAPPVPVAAYQPKETP